MRTPTLFLLMLITAYGCLFGQSSDGWYVQQQWERSLLFSIQAEDQHLDVAAETDDTGDFLKVTSVHLDDADLVVAYEVSLPAGQKRYRLVAHVLDEEGKLLAELRSSPTESRLIQEMMPNSLRWRDATEEGLYLGQSYRLLLRKELLWTFDCSRGRPEFTLRQQWPYYAGGLVGLSLLGGAEIYRQQKKEAYRQYRSRYLDGAPAAAGQEDPDLAAARQADRGQRDLSLIGSSFIAAGVAGWIIHRSLVRRDQRRYDRYCVPAESPLGLDASIENLPRGWATTLTLTYHF